MKLSQIPKTKPPFVPFNLLIETREELSALHVMAIHRKAISATAKELWLLADAALRNCE